MFISACSNHTNVLILFMFYNLIIYLCIMILDACNDTNKLHQEILVIVLFFVMF